MNDRPTRNCYVQVRLTEDERSRIDTFMQIWGYTKISIYLRDLLLQKRLPYRQEIVHVTDKKLLEKMNVTIHQVTKIGINYNQIVANVQKQSKHLRPDGSPYMNTRALEAKLTELMRLTEGLRDEFAVLLDVFKNYFGASQDTTTI